VAWLAGFCSPDQFLIDHLLDGYCETKMSVNHPQPFLLLVIPKTNYIAFRGKEGKWSQPFTLLINIKFCTLDRAGVGTPKYLVSIHKIFFFFYDTSQPIIEGEKGQGEGAIEPFIFHSFRHCVIGI
jgi:hypothetical protein